MLLVREHKVNVLWRFRHRVWVVVMRDRVIDRVPGPGPTLVRCRLVRTQSRDETRELGGVPQYVEVAGHNDQFVRGNVAAIDELTPLLRRETTVLGCLTRRAEGIIALHVSTKDVDVASIVVQDHVRKALIGEPVNVFFGK